MEKRNRKAFQIHNGDNVATALTELEKGEFDLTGAQTAVSEAAEEIPAGHKVALCDISRGSMIIKYGIPIGRAVTDIQKGQWVHLHCMKSNYDERSSHLDIHTGAPKDIAYE